MLGSPACRSILRSITLTSSSSSRSSSSSSSSSRSLATPRILAGSGGVTVRRQLLRSQDLPAGRAKDVRFLGTSSISSSSNTTNTTTTANNNNNDTTSTKAKPDPQDLPTRLREDLKQAMRSKDTNVIPMLKSLLSEWQILQKQVSLSTSSFNSSKEGGGGGSGGAGVISLVRKAIERRREASAQYISAKRPDLASKEEGEVEFLRRYLPAEMGEEELRLLVEEEVGRVVSGMEGETIQGKKLLGSIIKVLKERVGERVEGRRIRDVVEGVLKEKKYI